MYERDFDDESENVTLFGRLIERLQPFNLVRAWYEYIFAPAHHRDDAEFAAASEKKRAAEANVLGQSAESLRKLELNMINAVTRMESLDRMNDMYWEQRRYARGIGASDFMKVNMEIGKTGSAATFLASVYDEGELCAFNGISEDASDIVVATVMYRMGYDEEEVYMALYTRGKDAFMIMTGVRESYWRADVIEELEDRLFATRELASIREGRASHQGW
jgi:hypothetical protein